MRRIRNQNAADRRSNVKWHARASSFCVSIEQRRLSLFRFGSAFVPMRPGAAVVKSRILPRQILSLGAYCCPASGREKPRASCEKRNCARNGPTKCAFCIATQPLLMLGSTAMMMIIILQLLRRAVQRNFRESTRANEAKRREAKEEKKNAFCVVHIIGKHLLVCRNEFTPLSLSLARS